MRAYKIKISGYRPIPFCAEHDANKKTVTWKDDAFSLTLPTKPSQDTPMLNALIGANSSGKSSVLFALRDFFNRPTRLGEQFFNGKQLSETVIIEISFRGAIEPVEKWHETNCSHLPDSDTHEITIIRGWSMAKPVFDYVRRSDGELHKISSKDKPFVENLLPKFRIIMADHKPSDDTTSKKNSLIYDLIEDMVKQHREDQRSVIAEMEELIQRFERLVKRENSANGDGWDAIRTLEQSLSQGLSHHSQVSLNLHNPVTTVNDIFLNSSIRINDGVELDIAQHGLGMQRSFVVSLLGTWWEKIAKNSPSDYLFAIEEPEIYLHPHTTRVLLNELETIACGDQVLFTTHSSEFINRVPLKQVYIVRRHMSGNALHSSIQQPDLSGVSKKHLTQVRRYLQEDRSDMLFAKAVLLVEGQSEFFAFPKFARTIGLDLDLNGVSIVSVGGIDNIKVYHRILQAFNIPHVTMIDGDVDINEQRQQYQDHANHLFILDVDFEHMLVKHLHEDRFWMIINECRQRKGLKILNVDYLDHSLDTRKKAKRLANEKKPTIGRIVGELLTEDEIKAMGKPEEVLRKVVALAQGKEI